MVEIIKAGFDIFALQKTQGVNGWTTKAVNANRSKTLRQAKISLTERKTISF